VVAPLCRLCITSGSTFTRKTINRCGLCGRKKSSANTIERTPFSKQRDKLTADDADWSGEDGAAKQPDLATIYDPE
jgi:hypothetical protein